ncbi:hypothetical protein ACFU7T_12065 [Streptomyces sp. NPDC057555]|uniref:hypothetical protein n=1 Tax=Streptomyces sp. NPDC057555 TaxID=3346166 RepID=UPI0036A96609
MRVGSAQAWLSPITVNDEVLWCLVFRNDYGDPGNIISSLDQIERLLKHING